MTGAMTMDELHGILGQIRGELGESRAHLEHIQGHLEKINGRIGKTEDRVTEHDKIIERGRGLWWGVGVVSSVVAAAASWIAKHFLPLLFVAAIHAQTQQTSVSPAQLRADQPSAAAPTLLAITARGFVPVTLGPGFTVTQTSTGYSIAASSSKSTILAVQRLTRASDGTYPAPQGALVLRNGVGQTPVVDYAVSGASIAPVQPWPADDVVSAVTLKVE